METSELAEPMDWLHRNDNYVPARRAPPTSGEAGLVISHNIFLLLYILFPTLLILLNIKIKILNIYYAERQIPELRNNHVHVQSNEEEFDRELFEPAHDGWDSDEDAMDGGHGLHNENLYDDDGVIHRHAQGTTTTSIPTGYKCSFILPNIYILSESNYYNVHTGHDYESYLVPPEGPAANSVTHDDPYDYIYQNLPERHKLRKVPDCSYCGAMRFQGETPGFCCRKGKVQIHILDVPVELKRLFTSQVHDDAKYFRKHIRYINSHFAFASLGVTTDDRYKSPARTGVYTFRVHGMLYHRLDHLVPGGRGARHLQLYFYDTEDEALSRRVKRSPDLDINLIRNILAILHDNPYVHTFRRNGDFPNLDEYKIELNTNVTPDQRRYNAPTASQVAAIWMDGNDPQRCFDRSVVVYGKTDRRPQYIRAWHGCYDALAYPVYNPRGETGWNKFMPYSEDPFTPPSATMASTNSANGRAEGTTGGNHGIICYNIFFAIILVLLIRYYNTNYNII